MSKLEVFCQVAFVLSTMVFTWLEKVSLLSFWTPRYLMEIDSLASKRLLYNSINFFYCNSIFFKQWITIVKLELVGYTLKSYSYLKFVDTHVHAIDIVVMCIILCVYSINL